MNNEGNNTNNEIVKIDINRITKDFDEILEINFSDNIASKYITFIILK